jgi:hypothetical protein
VLRVEPRANQGFIKKGQAHQQYQQVDGSGAPGIACKHKDGQRYHCPVLCSIVVTVGLVTRKTIGKALYSALSGGSSVWCLLCCVLQIQSITYTASAAIGSPRSRQCMLVRATKHVVPIRPIYFQLTARCLPGQQMTACRASRPGSAC